MCSDRVGNIRLRYICKISSKNINAVVTTTTVIETVKLKVTGKITLWWQKYFFLSGHKGDDRRYYVLDFARTFPPEGTSHAISANFPMKFLFVLLLLLAPKNNPRTIFYEVLRPELVRQCEQPLNSDAFSGWNAQNYSLRWFFLL